MNRISTLIKLAQEELLASEILYKNSLYRASVSRAYYSIYHSVQALLEAKNITPKTHRGLIQQFGYYFIKTGELPENLGKILTNTFDLRQLSDYDESIQITLKQAKITLEDAQIFINETRNWINK